MKSIKYIIVPALASFLFAACNNEAKMPTDAELAPKVEEKVKAATDELKAKCDQDLLNAAQLKADSILAKAAGKKATPTPVAPKPAAAKVPAKAPVKAPTKAPVKTESQKVKDLFDKKAQAEKAKKEGTKVKEIFKNEGKKTEKEIKKEEEKVKSLFH